VQERFLFLVQDLRFGEALIFRISDLSVFFSLAVRLLTISLFFTLPRFTLPRFTTVTVVTVVDRFFLGGERLRFFVIFARAVLDGETDLGVVTTTRVLLDRVLLDLFLGGERLRCFVFFTETFLESEEEAEAGVATTTVLLDRFFRGFFSPAVFLTVILDRFVIYISQNLLFFFRIVNIEY
jgi:hypothetical protein